MHGAHFLRETALLFGAALVVSWLFRMIRAPAIIGYLFTGIFIGPSGLKLIAPEAVSQFAELGLVLLLFTVGLELSPKPLLNSGRGLLVASLVQITLTALFAGLIGKFAVNLSLTAALIFGIAVALSSTAIILKQLADLRQTDSPAGLLITGILLLQDVIVIFVMLLLPIAAGAGKSGYASATGRGLLSIAGLIGFALVLRRLFPPFLNLLLKVGGREMTTLLAVLSACAGAYFAERFGWSGPLGACIAGLLLAECDARHQLFADIVPFRDVFNALFFISMGMLVNVAHAFEHLPFVLVAIGAILCVKSIIAAGGVRAAGWPLRLAIQTGLGLCTVSEFAYILTREANRLNLLPPHGLDLFIAVIVGTMIVGALLVPISPRLALAISNRFAEAPAGKIENAAGDTIQLANHVIAVGFGLNGQNLSRVLEATRIPYCVVEMNRGLVAQARAAGAPVIIGDATQHSILQHAGIERARALVVAINDQEATRRIVAQANTERPDLFVLARTRYVTELDVLHRLGARIVIPEEFETSIEIFTHVLKHLGIPDNVIEAQVAMIRAGRYGVLRGTPVGDIRRGEILALLEATATQTFLLEPGSPTVGRTIRDLHMRATTGATIIAVVRGGKPVTNPTPEFRFETGDVLVIVGGHQQIDQAKSLLASPRAIDAPSDNS